jgi:hypothetical protein
MRYKTLRQDGYRTATELGIGLGIPVGVMFHFLKSHKVKHQRIGFFLFWDVDSFWEAYDNQVWNDRHMPLRIPIRDGWALSEETIAKVEECLRKRNL